MEMEAVGEVMVQAMVRPGEVVVQQVEEAAPGADKEVLEETVPKVEAVMEAEEAGEVVIEVVIARTMRRILNLIVIRWSRSASSCLIASCCSQPVPPCCEYESQ
jgi:hypothetical protein